MYFTDKTEVTGAKKSIIVGKIGYCRRHLISIMLPESRGEQGRNWKGTGTILSIKKGPHPLPSPLPQ
jgi:hypothetical protein